MKLYSFEPQPQRNSTLIPLWHLRHDMDACIEWEFNKILATTPPEEKTGEFKKLIRARLQKQFQYMVGKTRVTGRWKGIKPSDILKFPAGYRSPYYMVEKINYSNHPGVFKNPEDAVNSFFDSICVPLSNERLLEQVTHINDVEITK